MTLLQRCRVIYSETIKTLNNIDYVFIGRDGVAPSVRAGLIVNILIEAVCLADRTRMAVLTLSYVWSSWESSTGLI